MEIEIRKIHSFADHPFKVMDDEKMDELVASIRDNGVLVPVLLRFLSFLCVSESMRNPKCLSFSIRYVLST